MWTERLQRMASDVMEVERGVLYVRTAGVALRRNGVPVGPVTDDSSQHHTLPYVVVCSRLRLLEMTAERLASTPLSDFDEVWEMMMAALKIVVCEVAVIPSCHSTRRRDEWRCESSAVRQTVRGEQGRVRS